MIDPVIYDPERRYVFSNFSNEDFTGYASGVAQLIPAGTTVELPMFKAYLYTKHLVDREMTKDGKEGSMSGQEARQPYEDKCIAEITAGVDSPALASLKEKIKEEIEEEVVKKKGGRPAKAKEEVLASDKEFSGLK